MKNPVHDKNYTSTVLQRRYSTHKTMKRGVMRGGSWTDSTSVTIHTALGHERQSTRKPGRDYDLGFRLTRTKK